MQAGRREDAWRQLDLARARASADPVLAVEVLAQEAGLRSNLDRQSDAARVTAARALDAARSLAGAALGPANLEGDAAVVPDLAAALAGADAAGGETIPLRCSPSPRKSRRRQPAWTTPSRRPRSCREQWLFASWAGTGSRGSVARRVDSARRRVLPQAVLEIGAVLGRVLLSMGRIPETKDILLECSSLGCALTEFGPGRNYLVTPPLAGRGDYG